MGTQTFGKGIVQKIYPLSDGTAVKLTVSKYYTPNGNNIHGIGIAPDVEVELDPAVANEVVIPEEKDNQLQKAMEILTEKEEIHKTKTFKKFINYQYSIQSAKSMFT